MIAAAAALAACLAAVTLYFELTPGTRVVAASRKVGDVFRDCANCPEMVVVPAGRFMMGASDRELSDFDWARPGEVPVHEVRIAKPFAAGVFPVTRDEFAAFVKETNMPVDGGCYYWNGEETLDPTRSFMDPKLSGGPQAGDHPVVCVSHEEATRYVAWLSDRTGRNYRLLSDAEHEYVTRAGTTSAFWWGPTISPDQANYWSDASYHGSPTKPARFTTLPVKSFQPNPWGLYQVHGNVNEMVADCWHPDYVGAPADGSVWQMSAVGECKKHTGRGGSFINGPDLVRSAHRRETFDLREIGTGLRVARTLAN
jgi:formylglycine-generating enzyme required for sulfatase activity